MSFFCLKGSARREMKISVENADSFFMKNNFLGSVTQLTCSCHGFVTLNSTSRLVRYLVLPRRSLPMSKILLKGTHREHKRRFANFI